MEEMLKKTENIINLFKFREKEEINSYICENFYLTQSELREIFQILEDISSAKEESLTGVIKRFEPDFSLNGKKRGENFLEFMRKLRHPVIYEAKKRADERTAKIRGKNIKISYPENFEGKGIKLEIQINSVKEVKKTLEKLNGTIKELEELVEIVKNGG